MTSETEWKTKQKVLFQRWQDIGDEIKSLGAIVQNPPDHVTPEIYKEFTGRFKNLKERLESLWLDTFDYIIENCYEEWKEE